MNTMELIFSCIGFLCCVFVVCLVGILMIGLVCWLFKNDAL